MKTTIVFLIFLVALIAGLGRKRKSELDFIQFDGDDDLDEVVQYLIDEGFIYRDPTEYEKLFLPHPPDMMVTLVFERDGMVLHLIEEREDEPND